MDKHLLHEKREFENVRQLVEWAAEEYGDRAAYSYKLKRSTEKSVVSFNKLAEDVRALTSELISRGVTGRHACIVGKFSYEWVCVYYSVLCAGGVLVPLDRDWSATELAETAKRAECEFLFIDEDVREKADEVCAAIELKGAPVILNDTADSGTLGELISLGALKYKANPSEYHGVRIDPEALSLLVFTSGTTGKGKGVMLSQKAILSDLSSVIAYIDFRDKTVGVLPPHHTFGSSVMIIGHTMIGCEVYISAGLRYIQRELREQAPGHLILVPLYLETFYRKIRANIKEEGKEKLVAAMIKISNLLRRVKIDLRAKLFGKIRAAFGGKVSMIISGGAPINPEILAFFDAIGISTLNGYGITECAPIIAVNRSRNVVAGSVGNVLDIDTVRIDEPNEDGEGEILVSGPNVMLGYYKDEAATAEAMTPDGYFKTGDYGRLDEDGVLYITGRKKNLIILSNGKNVYPEEIENELIAVPGVQDIIVYEGKSRRGMEHNAIVAEIYPDKEYIEKAEISDIAAHFWQYIDEYNKTATPYKKIAVLKVREEDFPKNTLRKIMRFKLDMSIE